MKRVAFFTEILIENFDGASRTMFQLINRIDQHQFDYFFIYGNGPEKFRDFRSFKVPTLQIPANDDYSLAIPQLIKTKLEKALDVFNPDVIHIATPSLLGFYALSYARKRNIPVLTIYHTHFISYIGYYLRKVKSLVNPTTNWVRKTMLNFYNKCDVVYIPTQAIAQELLEIGLEKDRIHLWQRGIDNKLFNPAKCDKSYIQSITKNNKPNILFASRLVWEKNIKTLIAISKVIDQKELPYNLLVAGDGTAKESAMQEMKNAFFLGKQPHENLSKLYASADAFVFTSISETYGNVVIEAMASGLPCVIADGGGSGSLIKHGLNGYKCTPTRAEEYVYFLNKILTEPDIHQQLKEEGLQYISQLDWEKLSSRYFDDITSLSTPNTVPALAWAN